ncbi:uncharacterized protein JN550_006412 [Neoarthrinium moseri]|uniref:uncharacterized protein n=1 Tax=Neoarthrinium moseri TaxID=1658444 RepID=UPI001FDE101E|nr:uncharacterized protein JN550_006412 [Neoarthrinium moseri]KAI1868496.1 hypothetical protein JN550_006412 [Neoarthrinium moseri]
MSDQLVVVITGAGRGLGKTLAQIYLARPQCSVVGSVRDETATGVTELKAAPRGDGSSLLIVKIESSSSTDASKAVKEMVAAGIDHIDILIPNAGMSPDIEPIETVDISVLSTTFNVNAMGPLSLYQACRALLKKSKNPKFVPMTSATGSISGMEQGRTFIAPSYCISKAALNWITLAAHCSNEWLVAIAITPGLIATDMGNKTTAYLGRAKPTWTAENNAEKIVKLIDDASRENYSGKFMDAITGKELPW